MTTASPQTAASVLQVRGVRKSFRRETGEGVRALDDVNLTIPQADLTALVGPDGAGKTTLLRLATGLMTPDAGEIRTLGIDTAARPQEVQSRIAYMPQRFGLYEDLTVQENLDLYATLHAVTREQRARRYPRLMDMTALGPFTRRLAGRLSGGMKQKLGLACTLVRTPDLLLLDEPTVGVDPLSRRELWDIINTLVADGLTVILSTSYLDEAERCKHAVVMHKGKVLAQGPPADVTRQAAGRTFLIQPHNQRARDLQDRLLDKPEVVDAIPEGGQVRVVLQSQDVSTIAALAPEPTDSRFEDGFMVLLRQSAAAAPSLAAGNMLIREPPQQHGGDAVVQVHDLVRRFGRFTAVDHVSFEVHRGEIFGLLGPNGAGKTTTFRMLCGLLPASAGTLKVAGVDVRHARASARTRLGYVAQKFSLYAQLSVLDNLNFFASAYGLAGPRKRDRIQWAMHQFELAPLAHLPAGQLPGGFKQRLAMAAALLHEPEILFLDEPTSGADPIARREFWRRITALAQSGVTVIITTHFMLEAEYCDRAVIMDAGKLLAQGTPAELRERARPESGRRPTMEDAFVAIVEQARGNSNNTGKAA